jgi:8-hydroxy-5-deazaflavin:NADPH oxidoreductase
MHIAIIGAGNVGTTLGARFLAVGHTVTYGARNPDDPKHAARRELIDTIEAAVRSAELVLLTTSWAGAQDAIAAAGPLAGKILVDATNPIGPGMVLTHGTTDSGAEQVARWAPGAHVVKAFNTIGREIMANPFFGDQHAVLWLCGDDSGACDTVAELARSIGFDPLRIGPLARARVTEPAALLWITASGVVGTREFAWSRVTRA